MQPIHLLVVALRTALSAVVVFAYVVHLLRPRKVEPLTGASRSELDVSLRFQHLHEFERANRVVFIHAGELIVIGRVVVMSDCSSALPS